MTGVYATLKAVLCPQSEQEEFPVNSSYYAIYSLGKAVLMPLGFWFISYKDDSFHSHFQYPFSPASTLR